MLTSEDVLPRGPYKLRYYREGLPPVAVSGYYGPDAAKTMLCRIAYMFRHQRGYGAVRKEGSRENLYMVQMVDGHLRAQGHS